MGHPLIPIALQRDPRKDLEQVLVPFNPFQEITMPIIAWLLGVPLSVVLLLMLFGVF
jgi:hypothetical protein